MKKSYLKKHDVGRIGHIQRISGKRKSGSWGTQGWLIPKSDAHIESNRLIGDSKEVREVLKKQLGSQPIHAGADRFTAKPRPNIPEVDKPTPAQRRAQTKNIKKAQKQRKAILLSKARKRGAQIPKK